MEHAIFFAIVVAVALFSHSEKISHLLLRQGAKVSTIGSTDREFVRGLEHGLRVIESFDGAHTQMSLSEIARRTKLTPATARRSLKTLTSLGYVRMSNARYILGARVLALSSAYLQSSAAEDLLEPELHTLASRFGDTAGLSVLLGSNVLYIAYASSQRGMRPVVAGAGITFAAHATSSGRVLLGSLSDAELAQWFETAPLQKLTDKTETDMRRLNAIIRTVRRQGYAIVRDELYYGITSLAVPVINGEGRIVAALNSSTYSGLINDRKLIEQRLSVMQDASRALTKIMTAHPALLNSFATEDREARQSDPSQSTKGAGRASRSASGATRRSGTPARG